MIASEYDFLFTCKYEIEKNLGIPLNWWRFEGKSSYVDYHVEGIGIKDETSWLQMAKFHADWSKKFYDVFVLLLKEWQKKQAQTTRKNYNRAVAYKFKLDFAVRLGL